MLSKIFDLSMSIFCQFGCQRWFGTLATNGLRLGVVADF